MQLKRVRFWVFVISAALVTAYIVMDSERTMPGPLSAVHARIPELAGGNSCNACHGGWTRSMTSACLSCHAEIERQIDAHAGFHGTLQTGNAKQCATCHSDHHGSDFQIVNKQSFVRAGFPNMHAFEHGVLGFAMEGRHLELECTACHEHAATDILPVDAHRFLGLSRDCSSCHEDPHEGTMQRSCADCHDQTSFDSLFYMGHDDHLRLVGGHGNLDCRSCHAKGSAHALENLDPKRPVRARTCIDCHDSPHRDTFVREIASFVSMTKGASCVTCHLDEHTDFHESQETLTREHHARAGFPLDAPHDNVACEACHDPEIAHFAKRHPGRSPDTCSACHADVHGGQFDSLSAFANGECTACHSRESFEPHAFTVEHHARTALPLEGHHLELDCHACHEKPEPLPISRDIDGAAQIAAYQRPRVFHGTPSDCRACHADAHRGFFDQRLADSDSAIEDCNACHTPHSFSELPQPFDHEHFTGFALLGAHAQDSCTTCHAPRTEPDAAGRTFGFISDVFGPYEGCVTCHADPHEGAFLADDHFAPHPDGLTGCARCHVETSFRTPRGEFDHGRTTGFPLNGAHATAGCSACHPPLAYPDSLGRTRARAVGRACADCHEDPHAGQFEVGGRIDCARCHRSTDSFRQLSFNHNLNSRFPLDDAHENVACSACHKEVEHDGERFIRYRPLGTQCVDCHGDHREPLRRRKKSRF